MTSAGTLGPTTRSRFDPVLLAACLAVIVAGSALALRAAWRWPLVGDSVLIRYVMLLLHAGKAPYREIVDINLPGSYLLEAVAMRCFGWNAIGLRCYDGFLCLSFCALAWLLPLASPLYGSLPAATLWAGRRESLACLGGGLLFLLIHLQDGLTEAGQRDLALAVLMLAGLVVLVRGQQRQVAAVFGFELLMGFGLTVKPTIWPIVFLPLLLRQTRDGLQTADRWKLLAAGLAGLVCFPALAVGWLLQNGSLHAFWATAMSIGVLHGQLGRHGLGFLAAHCTAPVTALFGLWLVMLAARVLAFDDVRQLLLAAALCGLLSYVEQGKGLSYQRYPFLGLALVAIALDVARVSRLALDSPPRKLAYGAAFAAVLSVMLWFVPRFLLAVRSFDTTQPFEDHLAHSLRTLPGSVQCLDTFGGCIDTLYQLRLVQATGYLYDCYLFSPPSAVRDQYRDAFLRSFDAARPSNVVLTNQPCFDPAKNYDRLATWPDFDRQLQRDYRLADEWHTEETFRWWSRWERPIAYRVYVLR